MIIILVSTCIRSRWYEAQLEGLLVRIHCLFTLCRHGLKRARILCTHLHLLLWSKVDNAWSVSSGHREDVYFYNAWWWYASFKTDSYMMLKNIGGGGYEVLYYPSYVRRCRFPCRVNHWWIWGLSRASVPEAVPWFVLPAVCSWSTSSSRSKTVSLLCVLLGHYHDQRRPACCCFCSVEESEFWPLDPGDWTDGVVTYSVTVHPLTGQSRLSSCIILVLERRAHENNT